MVARNSRWWPPAAIFGLFAWDGVLSALADVGEPKIGIVSDLLGRPQVFEAIGLSKNELASLKSLLTFDPGFAEVFAVFVVDPNGERADNRDTPISGNYLVEGERLTFVPRHPLQVGLTYRAVLNVRGVSHRDDGQDSKVTVEREITVPARSTKKATPAEVLQIFPTSDVLPENHLRFYIQFSQPISRGEAYRFLELLDDAGTPIEAPFLEIGEELWDPQLRRFTLLLDPGRVKRGLKPREELGPVLENGKEYTLRIKEGWRDASGQPLASEFRKNFKVGPAIEAAIDLKQWTVNLPAAATNEPFSVDFPRSIDRALLERAIWVANPAGERVLGQIEISSGERNWRFIPTEPWHDGIYQLLIDANLEDTSGNSIRRPFEVDELNPITQSTEREIIRLPFEVSTSESPATAKAGVHPVPGTRR